MEQGDWNGPRVAAILACAAVIVVPIFMSDILGEAEEGVRSTEVQVEHVAVLVTDEIR